MKIINRGRVSGKTTMLIHCAHVTGNPILTYSKASADNIRHMAKELGFNDVETYSIEEYKKFYPKPKNGVLIDEAESVIEYALTKLLESPIVACTISVPMEDSKRWNKDEQERNIT